MKVMSMFAVSVALSLSVSVASAAKMECVADLPNNNPNGLPVAWWVTVDTESGTALVDYSGGPTGGVSAELVIPNVLPDTSYVGGYDINYFGYTLNNRSVRLLLAFKQANFQGPEMRFYIPFRRGKMRLLDVATADCRPAK